MKKIITILALLSLLVIVGCTSQQNNISGQRMMNGRFRGNFSGNFTRPSMMNWNQVASYMEQGQVDSIRAFRGRNGTNSNMVMIHFITSVNGNQTYTTTLPSSDAVTQEIQKCGSTCANINVTQ